MKHAFTVDVEDWYHGARDERMRASAERRLHYGMGTLLDILAERGVIGTFFWLAPAALEYPTLLRRLADTGHEIGCHGWSHEPIYAMSRLRFKSEATRALDTIADLIGKPVTAFRAPYFSITKRSLWALEILAENGIIYDSSICPVRHWGDGMSGCESWPQVINTPAGPIYELPVSMRRILGLTFPVSGGTYFRLYPYALTRSNFRAAEQHGQPVVFYMHPWELDPNRPSLPQWRDLLANHINLHSTAHKLRLLLHDFSFGPLNGLIRLGRDEITPTVGSFSTQFFTPLTTNRKDDRTSRGQQL